MSKVATTHRDEEVKPPIVKFWHAPSQRYVDYIPPSNKKELQDWLYTYCGLIVSEKACCEGHTAPLDAIAEIYFGEIDFVIWLASRGLGGKSTLLGGLGALKLLDKANVSVLGGSSQQSQRVHEVEQQVWEREVDVPNVGRVAIFQRFVKRSTVWKTTMRMGNWLRALTASTKSARGPHPQILLFDEVDEADIVVFDASMGQTMASAENAAATVISSTHHYPDGTFTEILRRAGQKGWPVRKWCYRENLESNGGWLTLPEVVRKKSEVTERQWLEEYELQEPSFEGRAFDTASVKQMFHAKYGTLADELGKAYYFEEPVAGAKYATGADWAQRQDYTVITTIRYDVSPARIVAFERTRRQPWPVMVAKYNRRVNQYPGEAAHDATGLGTVISDYLEVRAAGVQMIGETRRELWTDGTMAVEQHSIISPQIVSLQSDFLYCGFDDLYKSGVNNHPPDGVVSVCIAWRAALGKVEYEDDGVVYDPVLV